MNEKARKGASIVIGLATLHALGGEPLPPGDAPADKASSARLRLFDNVGGGLDIAADPLVAKSLSNAAGGSSKEKIRRGAMPAEFPPAPPRGSGLDTRLRFTPLEEPGVSLSSGGGHKVW